MHMKYIGVDIAPNADIKLLFSYLREFNVAK